MWEACEGKEDLVVLWLDFPNAYGSIPYELIENAMKHVGSDGHS